MPISYHGRTYEEGKKIGWKDGVKALGVILKFWLIDDLYAAPYGRGVLNNLTGTPQYLSWLTRVLRPYLGDTVLEIGAGIGNLSGRLMAAGCCTSPPRSDPLYLHALRNRFLRTPNVSVRRIDPAAARRFRRPRRLVRHGSVPERARVPGRSAATRSNPMRGMLESGRHSGRCWLRRSRRLYGALDRAMGHKRRFDADATARSWSRARAFRLRRSTA